MVIALPGEAREDYISAGNFDAGLRGCLERHYCYHCQLELRTLNPVLMGKSLEEISYTKALEKSTKADIKNICKAIIKERKRN